MKAYAVALTSVLLYAPAVAGPSITIAAMAPLSSGGYQPRTTIVSYDDLDPNTAQGAAALLDRIDAAARSVCGERSGSLANGERARAFAACRNRAVTDAVKAVGLTQQAAPAMAR